MQGMQMRQFGQNVGRAKTIIGISEEFKKQLEDQKNAIAEKDQLIAEKDQKLQAALDRIAELEGKRSN